MLTDPLEGKNVVILGFARQGQALARWLPTVGAKVTVSDTRDFGELADFMLDFLDSPITYALGGHPVVLLEGTDLLCLSGGVSPTLPICIAAVEQGIPLSNDAQLFLERCPSPVIGITGSAGKTTTTTLVGQMCEASNRTSWIGGNIGDVLLDNLVDIDLNHIVVMELSSFQLELMTRSPQIACVLNVTPNHLDRHGSMENYMAAKSHIFLHLMVVGSGSPDGQPHVVCAREDIRLRGEHNLRNVLAACAIAGAAGVPVEIMREVIKNFTGVAHRMEPVRTVDGVTYVNDSIATAPERVIAALRSYDEPIILLAGGRDKKLPWAELAALIAQKVRYLVTFGEFGPSIAEQVQAARLLGGRLEEVDNFKTLDEAVKRASEVAHQGDVVLLSPGGTSYDAYEDFEARGDHFRALVLALEERDRGSRR